ncbi:MAG: sulfatase [Acidobacteriota bacterium]
MLSRRRFAASLAATLTFRLSAQSADKPNLVIFLSDDHGLLDSEIYGSKAVRTPNMRRLAAEGMVFNKAFVASPSCAPSRAALLTGLYPARNGAEPNHTRPKADLKKLPAYLKELGYETAAFGKVSHYRYTPDYGFDHWGHDTFHDPEAIPAALAFLEKRDSTKPLCLFVGSNWPHVPWPENSEPFLPENATLPVKSVDTPETRVSRARYYAAVAKMDEELGRVYDLAQKKFGRNMVFLHTSDHGAQWPFGKWNLYDTGIRTPFVAVWPGVVKEGTRSDAMIQWIDILPTLVELGGGKAPTGIDGRSFVPVLRGKTKTHRTEIFTTHSGDGNYNVYPIRSVRTGQWKYIRNLHPEFQHTTHTNRDSGRDGIVYWRSWEKAAETDEKARAIVQAFRQRPAEELYDLEKDPDELKNLAGDPKHAKTLESLRRQLDGWLQATADTQKVYGDPLPVGAEATLIRRP